MQCVSLTLGQLKIIYDICFAFDFAFWKQLTQFRLREKRNNCVCAMVQYTYRTSKHIDIACFNQNSLNLHIQLHQDWRNAAKWMNRKFIKQKPPQKLQIDREVLGIGNERKRVKERFLEMFRKVWQSEARLQLYIWLKFSIKAKSNMCNFWEANWHTQRIRAYTWNSKQIASHKWIIVLWF